jgi:hypothetical protein
MERRKLKRYFKGWEIESKRERRKGVTREKTRKMERIARGESSENRKHYMVRKLTARIV